MIREPYNIIPYNSTIDTSRINEFGFTFSGDELGSWQAEVAKNNSSPEVILKTKEYHPTDAGYDRIFDGDIVGGTLVPSNILATNSGKNDGYLQRLYKFGTGNDHPLPVEGTALKVKFAGITADVTTYNNSVSTTYARVDGNVIIPNEGTTTFQYLKANQEWTNEQDSSYEFVGYLLICNNGTAQEDLAVQATGHTFVPVDTSTPIARKQVSNKWYFYLLNENEITATPSSPAVSSFSFENPVKYYMFQWFGEEEDHYFGDTVTVGKIDAGTIEAIEIKVNPYQDLVYDAPWAPGKGENKFNISSGIGIVPVIFTSEKVWDKYTYSEPSFWSGPTINGQDEQQITINATWNISNAGDVIPGKLKIVVTAATNWHQAGMYKWNHFFPNGDPSSSSIASGTTLNKFFEFYFGENNNPSVTFSYNFEQGKTYYLTNFLDNGEKEGDERTSGLNQYYFIISDGEEKIELTSQGNFTPKTNNAKIIGIGFYVDIVHYDDNIDTASPTGLNPHPVISENSLVTKWTPYSNICPFKRYNQFVVNGNETNIYPITDLGSSYSFYCGTIKWNKVEENILRVITSYKYIPTYDSTIHNSVIRDHRWWSTLEPYKKGTYPSNGASVYYDELENSYTQTEDEIVFPSLSPSSINRFMVEAQYLSTHSSSPDYSQSAYFNDIKTLQSPSKIVAAMRLAVGDDLIWRLIMWEPADDTNHAATTSFIKRGRFIQDANRISENTYEGEVSLLITENIEPSEEVSYAPVQIGNDLFIENKTKVNGINTIYASIMPSILYTNLAEDMQVFANLLTEDCILEISNYIFKITSAELSEDSSYISLKLEEDDGLTNNLVARNYYDYTIEFSSGETSPLINSYVEKYTYDIPNAPTGSDSPNVFQFGVQIGNSNLIPIDKMYYWLYSDGTPRAFYKLDIDESNINNYNGREYQLYSNFYISNWYFFQSRQTPILTMSWGTDGSFPTTNYTSRSIDLVAAYSQQNNVGVKYHTWRIDKINGDTSETVYQSNEIYNSDFNFTYDMLESGNDYTITLTVVNHDNVEISISSDLSVAFDEPKIDAGCTAIVNNNAHLAEITWMNGLSSEPDEGVGDSKDFGNHIGVGPSEQDVTIGEGKQLTYSTIAGAPYSIDKDNFAIQAGFVIYDDAKEVDPQEEFYDSTFLSLVGNDDSCDFEKHGLDVIVGENEASWKLLKDTFGQVPQSTKSRDNYYIGDNYIWKDALMWRHTYSTGAYEWTETQSNTNCYYYQITGNSTQEDEESEKTFKLNVQRTPFLYCNSEDFSYNIEDGETIAHTLTIPYSPLLNVGECEDEDENLLGYYPLWVRLYNKVSGTEKIVYGVSQKTIIEATESEKTKIKLTLIGDDQWPDDYQVTEAVVYGEPESLVKKVPIDIPEQITTCILGPKTYFFYFTIYNGNFTAALTPPDFGDKPSWGDSEAMVINATFNGTNVSSKQAELTNAVSYYKVYRKKYADPNQIEKDNYLYRRLIGQFNLVEENLAASTKFKFIDWEIENRGVFTYEIIPYSTEDAIAAKIISNSIITDWYGWSFTSIGKFQDTQHYEPIERWLFKLNIETNGYSHQTNKVFHQGFNRFPKASIGTTNYITTNLSCLIGDIRKELQRIAYYAKQQGYTRDTIETIRQWEDFSNTSDLILVKDYKGRTLIGVIDGNAMSFQDVVVEVLTTLSFNITQIDDAANYQIFSVEEG